MENRGLSKHRDKLGKLIFSGMAMGFNWLLLFEAFRFTSVALATLSYYFAPTIMVVGSFVVFKERLDTKQIICFTLSSAVIVLIIGVSGGGSNDFIGVLYGLGAAVSMPGHNDHKATGEIEGLTRTGFNCFRHCCSCFLYLSNQRVSYQWNFKH